MYHLKYVPCLKIQIWRYKVNILTFLTSQKKLLRSKKNYNFQNKTIKSEILIYFCAW